MHIIHKRRNNCSMAFYHSSEAKCKESLRQDTSLSTGTALASSESKSRFPAGSAARAVPVGVYVSCLALCGVLMEERKSTKEISSYVPILLKGRTSLLAKYFDGANDSTHLKLEWKKLQQDKF